MSDEIAPLSPAPKTLQALAVVLQEERRLISQYEIRHIVGQIK